MYARPLPLCASLAMLLLTPESSDPKQRPSLEISCRPLEELDGRKTAFGDLCASGETLFLGVQTTSRHRYFAAFSLSRADAAHWFFPRHELDESVDAQPELGFHWIATETPIDALPDEGEHRIVAFFSRAPLDREAIRDVMRGIVTRAPIEAPAGVVIVQKKILRLGA